MRSMATISLVFCAEITWSDSLFTALELSASARAAGVGLWEWRVGEECTC